MDLLEGGRREKWEGKAVLTAPDTLALRRMRATSPSWNLYLPDKGGRVFSSLKHDGKLPNDYFQNE